MKKVININFQGRVVPIEESAFEMLKNYIDSLQRYFAHEEGKDEIINDIESRIAELFSEKLKKGAPCIVEEDVTSIINIMGRVEDFEAEDGNGDYHHSYSQEKEEEAKKTYTQDSFQRGKFYRNADDVYIGGVCSGLANYLGVDPVLIRIMAVVFFTFFFWIYLLLWLIVPAKSIENNTTKRLFRDMDDRWLGGVCSGIAKFFNASPLLVRLLFAIPFAVWFLSGRVSELNNFNSIGDFPSIITGSFGLGLAFIYMILWIALPIAKTTSDKLEMRGEKVDVNNIQKKVKEEMESFKGRSSQIAEEVREAANNISKRAKEFGTELEETANRATKQFKNTAKYTSENVKQSSKKAGTVVGGLFKLVGMLIAAAFLFVLFASILAVTVGLFMTWPYVPFFLRGGWQYFLLFSTIIFFLLVPLIGLVVYFVKKLSGGKTSKNVSLAFGLAWSIGWISLFILVPTIVNDFKVNVTEEEKVELAQPKNTLIVKIRDIREYQNQTGIFYSRYESNNWVLMEDSLVIRSQRFTAVPVQDGFYEMYFIKESKGKNYEDAFQRAKNIKTKFAQNGDEISISNKLYIGKDDLFRDQELMHVLKIPIGKDVMFSNDYDAYQGFWLRQNLNYNPNRNVIYNSTSRYIEYNVVYRMTEKGLMTIDEIKEEEQKKKSEEKSSDSANTKIRGARVEDTLQKEESKPEVYEYPGTN